MKRTMAAYMIGAALAAVVAAATPQPAACQTPVEDELVRRPVSQDPVELEVWVNKGEGAVYRDGEEVGIRFRASSDCYVVIYDIDTEGFLSLLFPDDPYDDGFVEGGRVYRLPDPRARYELLAEGPPGIEYIAAVACVTPIAVRLPWYLSEGYEAYGYRGYEELEASVSDVGAIRGDPYVAIRDIAYDILPESIHAEDYDTDNTFFHVGRKERSHPRYLCYDCHGHVAWFDPYYDHCSVFEVRIDLDWVFVSHPVYYPVRPRWWYWLRHDCPPYYVDYPTFWCSLYPRHLYRDYYWDGLYKVGHRHTRRGGPGYISPRHRGRPGQRNVGYYGKRYRSPLYEKGVLGGSGDVDRRTRGKEVDKRVVGRDGRKYAGRGGEDLPRSVKQPERLGKLDGVRLGSKPDARSRGREKPGVGSPDGKNGRTYKTRTKSADRDTKARVKSSKRKAESRGKKSKLRIVTRSDKDKKSRSAVKKSDGRSKSKAKVTKKSKSRSESKAKVSKKKSGSSSKAKKSKSKSKASKSKSKSQSNSKVTKSTSKNSSGSKARKSSGRSGGKGSRSKKR